MSDSDTPIPSPIGDNTADPDRHAWTIVFLWVPTRYGGHKGPPYEAMRTQATWPAHPERSASVTHDVEWSSVELIDAGEGTARIRFGVSAVLEVDWTAPGEILEFRNGRRLLGVGRILG